MIVKTAASRSPVTSPNQTDVSSVTLLTSVWFGLVTGLLEAAVFTIIRYVPGLITWQMRQGNVSLDFFWIAPLVNLAGFVLVGAAILALELAALPIPR